MSHSPPDALELLAKWFTACGAFMSALSGIFLAKDTIRKVLSSEFFLKSLILAFVILIILLSAFLILVGCAGTNFAWFLLLLLSIVVPAVLACAELRVYYSREGERASTDWELKAAWVILVIGFLMLLTASIADLISFYQP
jgi:hypothetical protein